MVLSKHRRHDLIYVDFHKLFLGVVENVGCLEVGHRYLTQSLDVEGDCHEAYFHVRSD